MKTAIAFDYDGVIVDSLDANIELINNILPTLNLPPALTREHFNQVQTISFDAVGRAAGVPEELIEPYLEKIAKVNDSIVSKTPLFQKIDELIKELASEERHLYMVSNNDTSLVNLLYERYSLSSYMSGILGPEEKLSKAERLLSLKKSYDRIVMVGDALSDIRAAKEAEVTSIAVSWGFQSLEVIHQANPDYEVKSIKELHTLLVELTNG